jgi:hypothetical protein
VDLRGVSGNSRPMVLRQRQLAQLAQLEVHFTDFS